MDVSTEACMTPADVAEMKKLCGFEGQCELRSQISESKVFDLSNQLIGVGVGVLSSPILVNVKTPLFSLRPWSERTKFYR